MAPHSSTLAWKIPWMEEPDGLQSMGSLRVRRNWAISLSFFTFHFHSLEKEVATHSSVLAWRIPGTGRLVGCLPGASVRNSTHHKIMRQSSDGKANQTSGFPPGISWASTPQKIRICLLLHSSDILWKKSNQGFSLLHLKGMFQLKPPLITL